MLTLPVEKRASSTLTLSAIRASGRIPAVVYGGHHASETITVDAKAFAKVLKLLSEGIQSAY